MSQFTENFKTKAKAEAFAEKMQKNGYTNYVRYSTYYDCWKVYKMENQEFIPEEILPGEKIEQMANDIYNFLVECEMWQDVTIYFNGKAWSTHTYADSGMSIYSDGVKRFEYPADPNMYFDYVRNPHILSMSFEGDLYDELNYGNGKIHNKLQNVIGKYVANDPDCGECQCYFELGNAWNLSVGY